jgi:hypothetical protein
MECLFESKMKLSSRAKRELKEKMQTLFKDMRKYMREDDMLNDPMMKLLCDDIYITYKTMNSAYGMMFAVARCSSQGRQQTYNTTMNNDENDDDDDDYDSDGETIILKYNGRQNQVRRNSSNDNFSRGFSASIDEDEEEDMDNDEDDLDNYITTNNNTTCYSTPTLLNTMREMSQG